MTKNSIGVIENDLTKDGGKDRQALCDDVTNFTNFRVHHNQQKLVDLFNARPQFKLHFTDPEVSAIAEEDIRFPVGYKPLKSVLEENLETIKLKLKLEQIAKHSIEDKLRVISFDTPLDRQADIISEAKKLCTLKNCYINYKKMVRPKAEDFLLWRHNTKLKNEENMHAIVEQI